MMFRSVQFHLEMLIECPSTNEVVLARRGTPRFHGLAVLALRQTAAYGRRGRAWNTGEGNLALSIGLELPGDSDVITLLPFAAGIAAFRATRAFLPAEADLRLKWPNDLYLDGKKLGGMIAQARQGEKNTEVVLGIGINLREAPEEFASTAIAVSAYGKPPAPRPFAESLLRELGSILAEADDFAELRREWELAARLQEGRLFVVGEPGSVRPLELLPTGELLVEDDSGMRKLASETVSLRFQPSV